jgi:excisionase family DNA binding protein
VSPNKAQSKGRKRPPAVIPPPLEITPDILTKPEAASYLRVSLGNLQRKCERSAKHRLPVVKVGRLIRFRKADLDAYLARAAETSLSLTTGETFTPPHRRGATP